MARKEERNPSAADSEGEEEVYEVEKIVGHRDNYDAKQRVSYEFLVRWKNYPPSADTWEPRESLVEGAESILIEYIKRQERKGIRIWDDGTKKSKMVDVREEKPISKNSSMLAEPNKKKKRESEGEESREKMKEKEKNMDMNIDTEPSKKKARREEVTRSLTPPPTTKSKSKNTTAESANGSEASVVRKEKLAPTPPTARTANTTPPKKALAISESEEEAETLAFIKASLPKDEIPGPEHMAAPDAQMGSSIYRDEETWEHLLRIDTLEQDPAGADGYRWAVKWEKLEDNEWISNEIARRKFPQRALDFYESHLKFKIGLEGEEDVDLNGLEKD
ncbi:MAG: hypothetical protein CYPHOPRED_000655 [Cyphobasidiales sp. Tagirdzhanova-0007]|nr:MAG: hypothetical protein CYPHOPRED_000655 [Cyphobasidiales sp. Tagirdzhanova-0007]